MSLALLVLGSGLLSYWASVTVNAHVYQSRLAHRLQTVASTAPVAETHATRREANTSGLVGRLEIPRLGVSAMITEGVDKKALARGIGHIPETSFPGELGNVALAAHRDTYFRRLKDIALGDRIRLSTPGGVILYEVEWVQVVEPNRTDLLESTPDPELTLVTCYPFHWVGNAPKRFVVRCRRVDETVAAERPIDNSLVDADPMEIR